jgi:hypothetical protein
MKHNSGGVFCAPDQREKVLSCKDYSGKSLPRFESGTGRNGCAHWIVPVTVLCYDGLLRTIIIPENVRLVYTSDRYAIAIYRLSANV